MASFRAVIIRGGNEHLAEGPMTLNDLFGDWPKNFSPISLVDVFFNRAGCTILFIWIFPLGNNRIIIRKVMIVHCESGELSANLCSDECLYSVM